MLMIDEKQTVSGFALLNLGFRPFFLMAALFAIASVLIWLGVLAFGWPLTFNRLPAIVWHAHEMIYGYAAAVIAGFLLTAVRNWTGQQTLKGLGLLLLVLVWAVPRILFPLDADIPFWAIALLDCTFLLLVIVGIIIPIFRVKQWRQLGLIVILILLLLGNVSFYLGVVGGYPKAQQWGLYAGLYLIIALIMLIGRRVIPFFIERGVGYPVQLVNFKWLDIAVVVVYVIFFITNVFFPKAIAPAFLAMIMFILLTMRLYGWYTHGIWRRPLLWVLYLGYGAIALGFALKSATVFTGVSDYLVVHAFTYGGIGLMTIGMMARVALGHTGRSISELPPWLSLAFMLLVAGVVFRVLVPIFVPAWLYLLLVNASQVLWIAAFSLFLIRYAPILVRPRVDGRPG